VRNFLNIVDWDLCEKSCEIFLLVFFRCNLYVFTYKKSLLQDKEHPVLLFHGIISDFTQNRWSKDQKN
jgi:hypothetical protein